MRNNVLARVGIVSLRTMALAGFIVGTGVAISHINPSMWPNLKGEPTPEFACCSLGLAAIFSVYRRLFIVACLIWTMCALALLNVSAEGAHPILATTVWLIVSALFVYTTVYTFLEFKKTPLRKP